MGGDARESTTTARGADYVRSPTAARGGEQGDESVARSTGNMTQRNDDFLTRTDPLAEPRGGALNHGSSGYAAGLRGTSLERRTSRRDERRAAMRNAFVVGAGVMGAAVVAVATFTVLVFTGLFTVSSGVGDNHPVTLVQQPPATTTLSPSPTDAAAPTPPGDSTAAFPPDTTAQTGRSPLPSSNRVGAPRATAGAQVPAQLRSKSSGLEQLFSASSPLASDAPAPATPMTSAPDTNPAGHAPPGRNK